MRPLIFATVKAHLISEAELILRHVEEIALDVKDELGSAFASGEALHDHIEKAGSIISSIREIGPKVFDLKECLTDEKASFAFKLNKAAYVYRSISDIYELIKEARGIK